MKSEGQKQSLKHEKRLEKALGGQRSAGSGAFWSRKGDVRTNDFLIEHKWTGKKSFTLKSDVLEKIVMEAILDSRIAALGISLNGKITCSWRNTISLNSEILEMSTNVRRQRPLGLAIRS